MKTRIQTLFKRFSIDIEYHAQITSTNDLASLPGRSNGDVVWAELQTQGRGQRGNSWSSGAGENLTFSVVLLPEYFPAENQFYISKIVSIALVKALAGCGLCAEIKWPNDLYIGDRKTAGILIENDLFGNRISRSIIGIGLNVNQKTFDPSLPNPISMSVAAEKPFDRVEVLETVLERLFHWEKELYAGQQAVIDETYRRYLYRREGFHLFQEPGGEPFEASIAEVRSSGELILNRKEGPPKAYLFKEVEFIIEKKISRNKI